MSPPAAHTWVKQAFRHHSGHQVCNGPGDVVVLARRLHAELADPPDVVAFRGRLDQRVATSWKTQVNAC